MSGVKGNRLQHDPASALVHRCGAHLSIAGGMHKAIEAAVRLGCDALQVFVKNQRQWQAAPLSPADIARWHNLRHSARLEPIVAHASYLINMASPDRALCARSRQALAEELQRCEILDIRYLVIHPGATVGATPEEGIRAVAQTLDHVFGRHPKLRTMILLETTAGQGTALGRCAAELGEIIRLVEEPQRIGVCVDSCHVFAAGYDLRRPDKYRALVAELAREVGLKRVRCWHLNDCKGACGSRLDRHEHIAHGQLGSAAFLNILADKRFAGLPMILETPKGQDAAGREWDRVNLRRLRRLAARAMKRTGRARTAYT